MHSWVFRHRDRLRVIYGRVEPTPQTEQARPTKTQDAGRVIRRRAWVVVQPMPRRAG